MNNLVQILAVVCIVCAVAPALGQTTNLTPEQQKAADMRIPDLDRSALEPEKREPTKVPEGERNPFGLLALPPPEEKMELATVEAETEEMKIRRILGTMKVGGFSGQAGSYRVLLGPMQLREGDPVPKLFGDQAETLKVQKITEREMVLSFIEKTPDLPPRTIGLGIDMAPRVRSLLPGEFFGELVPFDAKGAPTLKPLELGGVAATLKNAEGQNAESLVERSRALMGEASPSKIEPSKTDSE